MSTNKIISYKITNSSVCEITLNNPNKRNPLSLQLINSLQTLFNDLKKKNMLQHAGSIFLLLFILAIVHKLY